MAVFHRPELAARLTGMLMRPGPTSAAPSGLFLAAPRRTGKSTFIVEDLVPALVADGALVLYVDLWSERTRDPAELIAAKVSEAVSRSKRALKRLGALASVESFSVGTVSVSRAGSTPDGVVPLGEALKALSADAGRPIVLIIDEAQHAITTEAGVEALFALKSARDALGRTGEHGLRIVATGSNRDKLAMLRSTKDQAFYGAPLLPFPMLDEAYVRWFVEQQAIADDLDPAVVHRAFERAGHRPEILGAAGDALAFELSSDGGSSTERLVALIDREVDASNAAMLAELRSLTPIQSAVLREMAAAGSGFAPFDAATMQRYSMRLSASGGASGAEPPAVTTVQRALSGLRARGLVWKATRGMYALEDAQLPDVMKEAGLLDLPSES